MAQAGNSLQDVIKKALEIPPAGKEELLKIHTIRQLMAKLEKKELAKTRRGFLVDALIDQIKEGQVNFVDHGNGLFISRADRHYCVSLHRKVEGRGRYNEVVFEYYLTVAEDNGVIISEADDDREYDDDGYRRPVMELYDFVANGKARKIPFSHVCGLMGYNPMIDDPCPACRQ
ncbi:MAG: hypothetical protein G01um101444_201 [Parcubacteria group bacterium Gr01-1014_44]|nr:MAG: hypothetical protein G01um101444_201 [Parcubacteria group bacterium Gr01-1014_44]